MLGVMIDIPRPRVPSITKGREEKAKVKKCEKIGSFMVHDVLPIDCRSCFIPVLTAHLIFRHADTEVGKTHGAKNGAGYRRCSPPGQVQALGIQL